MQVRVVEQVLPPGMEHGEEPDLGAQVLGIGGDGAKSLSRRTKEKIVNLAFVLESDGRDGLGQGKDHVEILDRQEFGAPIFEPLCPSQGLALRAMPIPARVVGIAGVTTEIAGFQVTPESRGPTGFDGVHDATLREGECAAARVPVCGAVATKDVRDLQTRPSNRGMLSNTEAGNLSE